jgi:hypothetical protein
MGPDMREISAQTLTRLRAAAELARRMHYAPYSGLLVLAAAETSDGAVGAASNIENARNQLGPGHLGPGLGASESPETGPPERESEAAQIMRETFERDRDRDRDVGWEIE